MSNPTLTLEEELAVLLPIYLIGRAKNWEFLSEEQVKKLIDNGRIRFTDSGNLEEIHLEEPQKVEGRNIELMVDAFMSTLIAAFEKALIEELEYCPYEEWESKDQATKWAVDKLVFYMTFEIKLDELPDHMSEVFSGNVQVKNVKWSTQN